MHMFKMLLVFITKVSLGCFNLERRLVIGRDPTHSKTSMLY